MTGPELKATRLRLDLSQRELVEAIGYKDPMSCSRWERGIEPIPHVVAMAVEHLACVRLRPARATIK